MALTDSSDKSDVATDEQPPVEDDALNMQARAEKPDPKQTKHEHVAGDASLTEPNGAKGPPARVIAALEIELEKSRDRNYRLSQQLAEKAAEIERINSSLGWRALKRYGSFKYRYFLPFYRLLHLPPYNRGEGNSTEADSRQHNEVLGDPGFLASAAELQHEAEILSRTVGELLEFQALASSQLTQSGKANEFLEEFYVPLSQQAEELRAARDQLLDLQLQLHQRDEILAKAREQVSRAALMFDRLYNSSGWKLNSRLRRIEQITQRWYRYRGKFRRRLVGPGEDALRKVLTSPAAPDSTDPLSITKKALTSMAQVSLDRFLGSNSTIEFPATEKPEVSILLVLYNRAELTLQCLYSILRSNINSLEVVIVDNASSDQTPLLLKQIKGAPIIQNDTNLHFLRAVNQGGARARGKYILLLNNDAQLMPGAVDSAIATLSSSDDIGAVGGKIVLTDGTLQEAGSIIWQDGSCLGYGRGDSPTAPSYMFKRDVDYCSGAFLLTPRESFEALGGFDEDYVPAYYEETDYCVRLWKAGKRVVYDPNAVILHYEFASSTVQRSAIELQIEHHKIFQAKNREWLDAQQPYGQENIITARIHEQKNKRRILFVDDRVPHLSLGSGFPRSNRILWELVKEGHVVTVYPGNFPKEDWSDVYRDIPAEVEVMLNHGWEKLTEFLTARTNYYDVIFISRPHNMVPFNALLEDYPGITGDARIVYDAEALFSYREIEQSRLEGKELSDEEKAELIKAEVDLAKKCDSVVAVSDRESNEFSKYGCARVFTLGHSMAVTPTPNDFDQRSGILFVGAIHSVTSPNADSMFWFCDKILPLVEKKLGRQVQLTIAGITVADFQKRITNRSVRLVGRIDDLTPLYNEARLFVAPTRFSAGIPLKVSEAAAYGLPTVATTLTGLQLGWQNERELLLADDDESFADACVRLYTDERLWNQLRTNILNQVWQDFSAETFAARLQKIIG